eukprot:gene18718-20607_t
MKDRRLIFSILLISCFIIFNILTHTDARPPNKVKPKGVVPKKHEQKNAQAAKSVNKEEAEIEQKHKDALKNVVEEHGEDKEVPNQTEEEEDHHENVNRHIKKQQHEAKEENQQHVDENVHKEEDKQHLEHEEKPSNEEGKHQKLGIGKIAKAQFGIKGFKLAKHPSCEEDVKELCSQVSKDNNFGVLVCLQDAAAKDDDQVSDACHQLLWHYKQNLTSSVLFDKAAFSVCETSLAELKDCQKDFPPDGSLVNCYVEHRDLVKNEKCQNFLTKMAAIVFSDYRLIKGFYQHCHNDVKKFQCGKLSSASDSESDPHTQAEVIECLEDNIQNVSEHCQTEIKRVAELSSDDYHLDRAVFYACQEDARNRFCSDVQAGQGRIYKCLMDHKFDEKMSEDCKEKLTVRQKLVQEDVKVNHALWEYCEKDFNNYNCKKGETEHGKASHLILCLNQAIADGKEVDASCQAEMQDVASQLFSDYKLNPEVMANCEKELHKQCKSELKAEGGALDCLMGLGDDLSSGCYTAVHNVLKETNAVNDFKIDRPLQAKCHSFIASACKGKAESLILSCLIDNIRADGMPPDCQKELFHLQFFLARDFSLDKDFYRDCKDDAKNLCNAPNFTEDLLEIPPGIVVACLFRASSKDVAAEHRVSPMCAARVKNAMHARSKSVKLMPEIEEPCRSAISEYCLEQHQESQEIECLQTNYEKLGAECKAAIANFTEMESEDVEMDQDLINTCAPMVIKFCQEVVEAGNSEGVLPCLIENKHSADMDTKCAASIEHWQILELKDVRFNHALKEACTDDIMKHCAKASDKVAAVHCLSEKIHKMAMKNDAPKISDACREQVRKELITEHEDIRLNPELEKNCKEDLETFCSKVWSEKTMDGQAKAETCLREKRKSLSPTCRDHLFQAEVEEVEDPNLDYELTHICKPMIKKYCMEEDPKNFLRCLREHKNDVDMTPECRKVVFQRQKEGAEDVRLDPDIVEFCKADVKKFCGHVQPDQPDQRGSVMLCLKKQLKNNRLSGECENFVRMRQEESALDYRLDPTLEEACQDEILRVCNDIQPAHGNVLDCLKENFDNIQSKKCKEELKRVAGAGVEDIHADPHLMQECTFDVNRYCDHAINKEGKVVECLLDVYNAKNLHLKERCESLLKKRMRLWSVADVDVKLDSISDIAKSVHSSPNRQYIYMVTLCFLAVIFIGGLCFGRVTKRVKQEYKDR